MEVVCIGQRVGLLLLRSLWELQAHLAGVESGGHGLNKVKEAEIRLGVWGALSVTHRDLCRLRE